MGTPLELFCRSRDPGKSYDHLIAETEQRVVGSRGAHRLDSKVGPSRELRSSNRRTRGGLVSTSSACNLSLMTMDATVLARCRLDHHAWINGDASPYELPQDGSIMGAVGGTSPGGPVTLQRQLQSARQWASGHGDVEYVNGGAAKLAEIDAPV